jgi:hypothetical protein
MDKNEFQKIRERGHKMVKRHNYAIGGKPDGGAIFGAVSAMRTGHEKRKNRRRSGVCYGH